MDNTLDGNVLEDGPIIVKLAGMYGLFAVTNGNRSEGFFSYSIIPGRTRIVWRSVDRTAAGSIENLPTNFPEFFSCRHDVRFVRNAEVSELGFGSLAALVGIKAQTYCTAHWKGEHPISMLIGVTLADADPWMRPFAPWICRSMTSTTLEKLAASKTQPPDYAACILVVHSPDRRKPGDAHETFEASVYEFRNETLARMN